ncbi:MAG: transposase [Vicinamibacteria bacterium]|nr:transposase [Vicinamibacteria bacterium]
MHRPYVNAVAHQSPTAEIVFDRFHVLQHASAALDEVRRQEFSCAGSVMRAYGRGKRWLLLRRWKTVRGSKRAELQDVHGQSAGAMPTGRDVRSMFVEPSKARSTQSGVHVREVVRSSRCVFVPLCLCD